MNSPYRRDIIPKEDVATMLILQDQGLWKKETEDREENLSKVPANLMILIYTPQNIAVNLVTFTFKEACQEITHLPHS